ncbi:YesL family protein [Microbacterium hydrocarbonoxydans]|uniref:YesL family protein n=1 Tax=Microbacterium hydrocarbonoxydans TaxID=273678 RepID=UPI0007BC3F4F|nr:DUF624 domain-containing protein [Microbacterium hydrocarbonoxydans]GAT71954.1 hypothetical protein MHM582_0422 [Microbacterium sp. HM58-2]
MAAGVFAQDSSLMRFLTRIADLMILNLLFLVTSVPVVTIGAALTALNFTAMRIATDTDGSIVRDYLRSFRRNLRQASILWLLVVVAGAGLAAWYAVVTQSSLPSLATVALLAIWYLLAFMSVMTALYVFPYLARFEGGIREVLRNARLMSIRHPLAPLVTIALGALSAVVTIHYPQATAYGLLWLMIGFSGIAFLAGSLFARVFERYAPTIPTDDQEEA